MQLTVAPGQRHNGTAGSGVIVDGGSMPASSGHLFRVRDPYFRMEWLEIRNYPGDTANGQPIYLDEVDAADNFFSHLIIHDYTSTARGGFSVYENATVRNCIIYNGDVGVRTYSSEAVLVPTLTLENVTVYGMTADGVYHRAGTLVAKNTISVGNGGQDFDLDSGNSANGAPVVVDGSSGYNLYSTVDAGVHPGSNNQSPPASLEDLFVSIVASSENLHLESSGHNALNTGVNLSCFFHRRHRRQHPYGNLGHRSGRGRCNGTLPLGGHHCYRSEYQLAHGGDLRYHGYFFRFHAGQCWGG